MLEACPICNKRVLQRHSRPIYIDADHDAPVIPAAESQVQAPVEMPVAFQVPVQAQAEPVVQINDQVTASHASGAVPVAISVPGPRAALCNRSKSMHVDRIQPGRRQRRVQSARNIRIARESGDFPEYLVPRYRLRRVSTPIKPYNIAEVKCFVCKKKFRQDVALEHYAGNFACSFICFRKI